MEKARFYTLPQLPYGYDQLQPHISQQQLTLHHQKHHQAYVNSANAILERIDKAREDGADFDVKATLKELSFHIGGHVLHSLFWSNLAPPGKGGEKPMGVLAAALEKEFGSLDRFKKEFTLAASSVEGSGWAALSFCRQTDRPIIMQIEKHNTYVYPMFTILMVIDVWEHAYYLDYKNDRAKFIDAVWNILNWDEVNRRLERAKK